MDWPTIALLIARYGVPVAMQMFEIFKRNEEPTDQDWADLLKLVDKSKDEYLEEAKKRLGLA